MSANMTARATLAANVRGLRKLNANPAWHLGPNSLNILLDMIDAALAAELSPGCKSVGEYVAELESTPEGAAQIQQARARLAAVEPVRELSERQFPMQRGPSIPWSLAEELYAGYSACYGTQQSLERLAERSGFSWAEIEVFWQDKRFRQAIDIYRAGRRSAP